MTTSEEKPALRLVGEDGNAYAIMGRAQRVARRAGWSRERIKEVMDEAMADDYDHLLRTMMKHFDCDGDDDDFNE
jgi:hypothetical protein